MDGKRLEKCRKVYAYIYRNDPNEREINDLTIHDEIKSIDSMSFRR